MISVEKKLLFDLIDSKLKVLQEEINAILKKWHYTSVEKFFRESKQGVVEEAEDDAICLKNLVEKRDELLKNKWQWNDH